MSAYKWSNLPLLVAVAVAVVSCFCCSPASGVPVRPAQIRLALTGITGELVVGWATTATTVESLVEYSCDGCGLSFTQGTSTQYSLPNATPPYVSPQLHFVTLRGLNSSTTYHYRVGSRQDGWSDWYQFLTASEQIPSRNRPLRILSIGDEGTIMGAKEVFATMLDTHNKLGFDFIVHAGDISYADVNEQVWDDWGLFVQPLAVTLPWMMSPGNHEMHNSALAYMHRFAMPTAQSGAPSGNRFYSWNYGNTHFIALDSEALSFGSASPQYQWLLGDLERVDRKTTPWVIAFWHRPWYSSNAANMGTVMKDYMEDLLYQFKVDIIINGHVHAYERTYPTYKGEFKSDAPVFIINGSGGKQLDLEWKNPAPEWSAYRVSDYGVGYLEIMNSTHSYWTMLRSSNNTVIDGTWIVRPKIRI